VFHVKHSRLPDRQEPAEPPRGKGRVGGLPAGGAGLR